jgi:hypothetical protein
VKRDKLEIYKEAHMPYEGLDTGIKITCDFKWDFPLRNLPLPKGPIEPLAEISFTIEEGKLTPFGNTLFEQLKGAPSLDDIASELARKAVEEMKAGGMYVEEFGYEIIKKIVTKALELRIATL